MAEDEQEQHHGAETPEVQEQRAREQDALPQDAEPQPPAAEEPITDDDEQEIPAVAFPIVCLGASAGGLEALESFFSAVPAESGMAFVVITHLDPHTHSKMPELLQARSPIPVDTVQEGAPAEPNRVYVIPPSSVMSFHDGRFFLEPREKNSHGGVIDVFLGGMAGQAKDKGVAIILSGTGRDGTRGIQAVKTEGGLVIAQSPDTARFPGMPQSAMESGLVDFVLPPSKMAERLIEYFAAGIPPLTTGHKLKGAEASALRSILSNLRSITGHDFTHYKKATILRRIQRRMRVHQLNTLQQYARMLQEKPQEGHALFHEILIGATNFFRDPGSFAVLKEEVLPILLLDKPHQYEARVWLPGVATGEEAYSMAIVFDEFIKERKLDLRVQIFATDINPVAIEAARIGEYPATIAPDVGPERLERYFTKYDNGYKIKHPVREMVVFASQDIVRDPPFISLDLLCCRNLLIYLDHDLQQRLIPLFHYSLRPGGVLFLGASESIGEFHTLFQVLDTKWKIYRRKETGPERPLLELAFARGNKPAEAAPAAETAHQVRVQELEREMLLQFAPPSVIIGRNGEIHYVHGRTGTYLEPAQGKASFNILHMAREGLNNQLPQMIAAAAQGKTVFREHVRVKNNGGAHRVNVTVKPFGERQAQGLLIVTFEEVAAAPGKPRKGKDVSTGYVEELERELTSTKEDLQSSIEELQTSNEELRSVNEEYQSTNEELQSTNEELETSREEMQSLNEELTTVNSELQRKIDDLVQSNDLIRLFLDSLDLPTLFLGKGLGIERFTRQAGKLFNIMPNDIGRPLTHFSTNLEYKQLVDDVHHVYDTGLPLEKEVRDKDGKWYLLRARPYSSDIRAGQHGVVVTFVDIDMIKRRDYPLISLELFPEPLLLVDRTVTVLLANKAFFDALGTTPDKVLRQNLFSLSDGAWAVPPFQQFLAKVFAGEDTAPHVEFEVDIPPLGRRRLRVNACFTRSGKTITSPVLLKVGVLAP